MKVPVPSQVGEPSCISVVWAYTKFEDTKGVVRICKWTDNTMANIVFVSKKDRQYNGQYCLCF